MQTILMEEYTGVCGVPQGGRGAGVQVHAFHVPQRWLKADTVTTQHSGKKEC